MPAGGQQVFLAVAQVPRRASTGAEIHWPPLVSSPLIQLQVPAAAKLVHHPPLRIAKPFSSAGKLLLDLVLVWRRPPPRWLLRPKTCSPPTSSRRSLFICNA